MPDTSTAKPEIVEDKDIPEEILNEQEQEDEEKNEDDSDAEELDEGEDEDEDEEEEEDGDEEFDSGEPEDDEEIDHPSDQIQELIDEIGKQEKRLSSRNAGSLKYELTANVYPILKMALGIISDFMEYSLSQKDEDEEAKEAFIDSLVETKEIAEKVLDILDPEKDPDEKTIKFLKDWAKSHIEKTDELLSSMEEE